METLFFAADHAGVSLKASLIALAKDKGYQTEDLGTNGDDSVDYPDYAHKLADAIKENGGLGIAICGSGIGISIALNRHPHIRAALCTNSEVAALARQHNDANILCLGARFVDTDIAHNILEQFLTHSFEGGRHQQRVTKINPNP